MPISKTDRQLVTASLGTRRAALASAPPDLAILPASFSTLIALLPVLDEFVKHVQHYEAERRLRGTPLLHRVTH
jgi:hypothetical protein